MDQHSKEPDDEEEMEDFDEDLALEPEGEEEGGMTLWDHLEELRWTLFKSGVAFAAAAILILFSITLVADFLQWPLNRAIGERQVLPLITTGPLEVFMVFFHLVLLGGFFLALPFILYFVARFIAPGLTPRELSMLRPACIAAFFLFLIGASFTYFFILPLTLSVSMFFNEMLNFEILWTANRYFGILVAMVIGVGFLFQFPLILVVLIKIEILTTEQLQRSRRIVVVIILIVSALITPSDPISLFVLAIPLWILFELSLVVGKKIEEKRALEAE